MLISYNWLKEYLDGKMPKPEELVKVLNEKSPEGDFLSTSYCDLFKPAFQPQTYTLKFLF